MRSFLEGSWDNWTSRIIVDGVPRHVSELPHVTDERGQVADLLDIHANYAISSSTCAVGWMMFTEE